MFISMNYILIGSGQDWQIPSLAIKDFGHGLQNVRSLLGTKPSGQDLHESSKLIISSGLQREQEYLSPLGN